LENFVDPLVAHHRARVAHLSRYRSPADPELDEARRDLAEAVIAEGIRTKLASAPPLNDEQISRLSALLRASHSRDPELVERARRLRAELAETEAAMVPTMDGDANPSVEQVAS
jgi:hypothetical protein